MPEKGSAELNLLRHLQQDGFLRMAIPGKTQKALRLAFEVGRAFFQLPSHVKHQSLLSNDLGFRPFSAEYSRSSENLDQMESFSARETVPITGLPAPGQLLYTRMQAVIRELEPIAEKITAQLAHSITAEPTAAPPPGAFRNWSFLQLNYSRPREVRPVFINELHEDGCLITIASNTGPGLEIRSPDGSFLPLEISSQQVIVMPGEILWLLSGGAIEPLFHRVRADRSSEERMSLLFFGDIDPRLCGPWVANAVNDGIDIGDRVLKNPTRYGLKEWQAP